MSSNYGLVGPRQFQRGHVFAATRTDDDERSAGYGTTVMESRMPPEGARAHHVVRGSGDEGPFATGPFAYPDEVYDPRDYGAGARCSVSELEAKDGYCSSADRTDLSGGGRGAYTDIDDVRTQPVVSRSNIDYLHSGNRMEVQQSWINAGSSFRTSMMESLGRKRVATLYQDREAPTGAGSVTFSNRHRG